ncbi:MAG: chemotaxis response regulator protein-glutamate methylesterase [Gemmatimonadota bacterium]
MNRIRVLVVDDAVVVRRMVSDALGAEPLIEVVGTASNGRLALERITQLQPDLVTLDIDMPEMDGLETLAAIRKSWPRLPVIMFSTLTERGALTTLDALALGASDYVTKPSHTGSIAAAQQRVREQLTPKVLALCSSRWGPVPAVAAAPRIAPPRFETSGVAGGRVDVVTIGVSTGGPNALATILSELPVDFPVPIVIVQHMPPLFTRFLADRLTAASRINVREAEAGGVLTPGAVWIAPGNFHMTLYRVNNQVRMALNQDPPEHSCRPAADVLFRSVAEVYGARSLAVVLTGMGQDGTLGCERIREAGGQVIAQDEATSVVWGMPGYVVGAGLASAVVPLDRVASEMCRRVSTDRLPGFSAIARAS